MAGKALPKRCGRAPYKLRYQNYLTRSTCSQCRVVFKSPKKRLAHVQSGHKDMTGANKNRQMKTASMFAVSE